MIEVRILNTQEVLTSELRALALFLNTLAADRESPTRAVVGRGAAQHVENNCGDNTKPALSTPPGMKLDPLPEITGARTNLQNLPIYEGDGLNAVESEAVNRMVEASLAARIPTPPTAPVEVNLVSGDLKPVTAADLEAMQAPKPTPAPHAPTPADVFGSVAPPPAPPLSDAAQVALDKAGLPWDSRIHSSSKAINQTDGLWRSKRGVADDVVARVTAELQAVMAIPKPDAPLVASIPTSATVTDASNLPAAAPSAPPAPPVAPVSGVPANLGELMTHITRAETAGTLTREEFTAAWQATGVVALPLLASRPDLIAVVYHSLAGKL